MKEIAVIGGGAAGMGAAYRLLEAGCQVTLVEVDPMLGGDCFGVPTRLPDGQVHTVDAGVSDFNQRTFVEVRNFLEKLGVGHYAIDRSASFMRPTGNAVWHANDRGELTFFEELADEPRFRQELARFKVEACEVLSDTRFTQWSLSQYLTFRDYSQDFCQLACAPRAIGCFPMPNTRPEDYSVRSLVSFWTMHGVVGEGPAERMCVDGGMFEYCRAFQNYFEGRGGRLLTSTRAVGIARRRQYVEVRAITQGDAHLAIRADAVAICTNSNEVLPLIEAPSDAERAAFQGFPFQRARLCIHQDPTLMPRERAAWAAYNYLVPERETPEVRPTITFYTNRLGKLREALPDFFVTMNPFREPDPEATIADRFFVHPVADADTLRQARLVNELQGQNRIWFGGSYLYEPFVHEQALVSGLCVGEMIAASL